MNGTGVERINGKKLGLLGFALLWLIIDQNWISWLFSYTVYASIPIIYFSFLLVFILFVATFLKQSKVVTPVVLIWLPFVFFSLFGYLAGVQFQRMIYWFAYFTLLLVSAKSGIWSEKAVFKLIFYGGIFALIGVYVQFFFNSFYTAYIKNLFTYEGINEFMDITDAFGMNGFTYQQGTTSMLILSALFILLYFKDSSIVTKFFSRKLPRMILIALMVIGIFLTGKRTMSVIAVIVPVIVYYFSRGTGNRRFFFLVFASVAFLLVYNYILPLLLKSEDIFFLKRISNTIDDVKIGATDDWTSGRQYLWNIAMNAWREHPILGIGVGNFPTYSKMGTDVHNTYLQVLCEQGIIAFVFYVFGIVYCLVRTMHSYGKKHIESLKPYLNFSLAVQLYYIVNAITGNANVGGEILLYFIAIAFLNRIDIVRNREAKKTRYYITVNA